MVYWQVAAGDSERRYSNIFLKYGVMLIGSGEHGDYLDKKKKYKEKYGKEVTPLRQFAEEVKPNDMVVLKEGKKIVAIGKVPNDGKYEWLEQFCTVEGFYLQHAWHIKWRELRTPKPSTALTINRFSKIDNEALQKRVDELWKKAKYKKREDIPTIRKLSFKDMGCYIKKIRTGCNKFKKNRFEEIRKLVEWYKSELPDDINVSEHEMRTFLVYPFLKILGYTEQQMKIEWENIDIAISEKISTIKVIWQTNIIL